MLASAQHKFSESELGCLAGSAHLATGVAQAGAGEQAGGSVSALRSGREGWASSGCTGRAGHGTLGAGLAPRHCWNQGDSYFCCVPGLLQKALLGRSVQLPQNKPYNH